MKQNEFLRSTPRRKSQPIVFDLLNWLFPIFSLVIGFWISAQIFARLMNYDPRVVGYPILILKNLNNYRLYHPALYFLAFLKFAFRPGYGPYFYASLQPGLIGTLLAFTSLIFFAILKTYLQKAAQLYGTARWAKEKDLKKFGLLEKHGIILGQTHNADIDAFYNAKNRSITLKSNDIGKLICHSAHTNTLLLAPTRSGKGVSVIVPSLLNYPGSAIIFDPKGENWNITAGFRSQFSHCLKFSPLSRETIKFNPMDEIRSGDYAFADANQIADILYASDSKSDATAEYFNTSAKGFTTGVILHVKFSDKYKEKNLSTVLRVISLAAVSDQEAQEENSKNTLVEEMINGEHTDDDIHEHIRASAARLTTNPKERASVLSTVFSKLQLFEDPLLANATSSSDFKISDFIESKEPISLYLTVPFAHIDRVSLVFRLIINFMLRKFSEGETQFGEIKLKNHLVFFLDEFPVLGYFPFIAKVMGILAGYGVTFLIVCQGLNQLIDLYQQNHPFLDHCKNIVIFQPAKIEDAEMFSKMVGKESVVHDSVSNSGRKFSITLDNLNVSSQEIARDLINPDELMKLPYNECLIMNQGMPPYIAKKCVYYDDERFKDKAFLPVPFKREDLLLECQALPSNKNRDLKQEELQKRENIKIEKERVKIEKEKKRFTEFLEPVPKKGEPHFSYPPDPELAILVERVKAVQEEVINASCIEQAEKDFSEDFFEEKIGVIDGGVF